MLIKLPSSVNHRRPVCVRIWDQGLLEPSHRKHFPSVCTFSFCPWSIYILKTAAFQYVEHDSWRPKTFFFKCCVWCHTGGVLINKFTLITTKYFILPRTGLTSVHWHMLPKELLSFRELKYRQIVGIGFCYITHRPTSMHRIYPSPSKHTHSLELHAVHPILVKYNILSSNSPSARFYFLFLFFSLEFP